MWKKLLLWFARWWLSLAIGVAHAAGFTPGNLVVVRVGDGSATLSNDATVVFLDEYTPSGTLVQSIPMPTTASGSNQRLTMSGTAVSEGTLLISPNGQYLTLAGYDAAIGTSNIASTISTTNNRIVARVDMNGNVDTSTTINDGYNTGNIRSAVTDNGTRFWTSGTGASGGTRYVSLSNLGTSTPLATDLTNSRVVNMFDGQLYVSASSGTNSFKGISKVGTGLPTISGTTTTRLTGLTDTNSVSIYGFTFLDRDNQVLGVDTLYLADDGKGLLKFSFDGSTWVAQGSLSTIFIRGLTATLNGTKVEIYATTVGNTNSIVHFTDTAAFNITLSAGSFSTVVASGTNKVFRGLARIPYTKISAIQGNSTTSPLIDSTTKVTIQGIVTGDFQTSSALNGFYVQAEDSEVDNDPLTSEGIFVYNNTSVQVGDLVTVTGTVTEFYDLTELNTVTNVTVLSSNHPLPTAAIVNLPFPDAFYLERFEGMLVTLPQTLTVTDTYDLPKYGEIVVANGRLLQPTQVATPGPAANTLQAQNDLNQLVIDDGRTGNYRTPFAYNFTANHPVRIGSTVTNLTGVLHYDFGQYRVHPTSTVTFADNSRPPVPNLNGSLTVASFNVLNYFISLGNGVNCGPAANQECRGANTATELTRQQQKLVATLSTMNADIVGLMELENNRTALHQLVTQLNNAMGAGTYHYLNTGILGSQVITTGLIYKPAKVSPVGPFATKLNGAFATNNRVPLAQTFLQNSTGGKFTVVVNHFKSKSGCPNSGADADHGDGQNCWNASRRQAAQELTAWLAKDPTGSGDTDLLIIGDLNSYAQEDPITVFKQQGYTNLVEQFLGPDAYSFVFFGQAGTLDYALASNNLVSQITGVAEWHINADEHYTLDYNQEDLQTSPVVTKPANFFQADPYRSTDHDPLLIGLTLLPSNLSLPAEEIPAKSPQTAITVFTPPLPPASTVLVEIQGTGQGRVNSEMGLACETSHCTPVLNDDTGTQCQPDACRETVNTGTTVILTPQAAPGSVFTSWGGHEDCADGRLTMNGNKLCIAFFQAIHQLAVTIHGPGMVKSHDYLYQSTGIQCGNGDNQCSASFSYGTTTFLQAVPAKDTSFVGWGGHCAGTRNPLAVAVRAELTCEAHFQKNYSPAVTIP